MLLVLILAGVSALFGALSIAYVYSRADKGWEGIRIPILFLYNTCILLFSSWSIERCRRYFNNRNEILCFRWGLITIIATLLFLVMQAIAWYKLLNQHVLPGSSMGHGYLYALSILHFFHVMAGIPFLVRILVPLMVGIREGNAALFFLDEEQQRRLKLTAWYWHFIDVVWIFLIAFFLTNYLI